MNDHDSNFGAQGSPDFEKPRARLGLSSEQKKKRLFLALFGLSVLVAASYFFFFSQKGSHPHENSSLFFFAPFVNPQGEIHGLERITFKQGGDMLQLVLDQDQWRFEAPFKGALANQTKVQRFLKQLSQSKRPDKAALINRELLQEYGLDKVSPENLTIKLENAQSTLTVLTRSRFVRRLDENQAYSIAGFGFSLQPRDWLIKDLKLLSLQRVEDVQSVYFQPQKGPSYWLKKIHSRPDAFWEILLEGEQIQKAKAAAVYGMLERLGRMRVEGVGSPEKYSDQKFDKVECTLSGGEKLSFEIALPSAEEPGSILVLLKPELEKSLYFIRASQARQIYPRLEDLKVNLVKKKFE